MILVPAHGMNAISPLTVAVMSHANDVIGFSTAFPAKLLANAGLTYQSGGTVAPLLGSPPKALADFIRDRNFDAIDAEFRRAITNAENDPREAVSAASNILESPCKIYIEDEGLEPPAKLDLQGVWTPVRKHLGFDPAILEDQDLKQILSGILSVVHGVGSLRTHSSSAHGAGRKAYKLEPRHARLAIHSAHTVALFILESWKRKRK
jgi:Abortive infection C-terminus